MPPRVKKPKLQFEVNVQIEKNKFERLEKTDDVWFKKYTESFSFKIDRKQLSQRLTFLMSLVSDFSTSLNVRFCDDFEMRNANFQFLKKDGPTDVLSFPVLPHEGREPGEDLVNLGDILICVPVCYWQAEKHKHTICDELEKMLVHGIVHLKGFDHERGDSAWRVMTVLEKALQKELVNELGVPVWCQTDLKVTKKGSSAGGAK